MYCILVTGIPASGHFPCISVPVSAEDIFILRFSKDYRELKQFIRCIFIEPDLCQFSLPPHFTLFSGIHSLHKSRSDALSIAYPPAVCHGITPQNGISFPKIAIRRTSPMWPKRYGTTAMWGKKQRQKSMSAGFVWRNIWKALKGNLCKSYSACNTYACFQHTIVL